MQHLWCMCVNICTWYLAMLIKTFHQEKRVHTVRSKSTRGQDDMWAPHQCLPFHSFLFVHSVRFCFHKQLWQVLLWSLLLRDKLQQLQPPALWLQLHQCTVWGTAAQTGQCHTRTLRAALQYDLYCRLPRSSGVKRVLCRSGRGWRPSSVCVLSIISRTVLWSWLKQWQTGCSGVLRQPPWTQDEGCPIRMWTNCKDRQRTMRKPRERSAAVPRARIKR